MAGLQERSGSYRILFRYHSKQHVFTLGKVSQEEAETKCAQVDYLLLRLKQRLIELPPGVDIVDFIRFDVPTPGDVLQGNPGRLEAVGSNRVGSEAGRTGGRTEPGGTRPDSRCVKAGTDRPLYSPASHDRVDVTKGEAPMVRKCVLALVVVAGATMVSSPPGDPTRPAYRPGAFNQHESDLASARAAQPRVIFLGDSITNRWRSTGRATWDRMLAPLGAAHLGVGEDSTEHLLWRLEAGEFRGLNPEIVVILIGTNNLPRDRADDITCAIGRIAAECRASWPTARVVVMGIFPRGDRGSWRYRRDIARINSSLSRMEDGDRVRFLDIGSLLSDQDGYAKPDCMPDGVHLSEFGYAIWARELVRIMGITSPSPSHRS